MKRTLILAALAVLLPTGGAVAQSIVDIRSQQDPWVRTSEDERPPRERPEHDTGMRADDNDESRPLAHAEERNRSPGYGRAARFHIEDGQSRIDLRCPDDEPMRTCADVLLQVLDRMQAKPTQDERSWREDRSYRSRPE